MVQHVIEPFNVDVIKVTIKDKPGVREPATASEAALRLAFELLKHHAEQSRRLRKLQAALEEKSSRRRVRRCFDVWLQSSRSARRAAERAEAAGRMSKDAKIEVLVSKIAEKQKELQQEPHKAVEEHESVPARTRKLKEEQEKRRQEARAESKKATEALVKSRIEAQKVIIKEQKAKLDEQSRRIEEMKLKEIDKEARRTSRQTIDAAKQALSKCNQSTRRSLIQIMREEGCRDQSIIEIPRIPSPPRFLIRMEARAEARKERIKLNEEVRQRRRDEQKKREEASRQEVEEEQRKKQIQAMKETIKLRREQEERRRKEIEKYERLNSIADQFYRRLLFRRYAMEPLLSLVEENNERLKRADQHYAGVLLTKIFSAWKSDWVEQREAKLQLASKFYCRNLLWYAFDDWKSFAVDMKQKYQVAVDFHELKVLAKSIKVWYTWCAETKAINHEKEMQAIKLNEKKLKKVYFSVWKKYMFLDDTIKEREQRREEWRNLIRKFIPDSPKAKMSFDQS